MTPLFTFHPCIKALKKKFKVKREFLFNLVSTENIKRIINDLDIKKGSWKIPTDLFKNVVLIWTLSQYVSTGSFPDSLDQYTKNSSLFMKIIIDRLSIFSYKVYKRVIYDQVSTCFEHVFNELLRGFRKAHTTSHALFKLLTLWQNLLLRVGFVGFILMTLS